MGKASITPGADGTMRFRFVKINPDRGYGDKPHQVLDEDKQHYTVQVADKSEQKFMVYKALTYRDRECIALSAQFSNNQKSKNCQIGRRHQRRHG
jgi:hypothetical protein